MSGHDGCAVACREVAAVSRGAVHVAPSPASKVISRVIGPAGTAMPAQAHGHEARLRMQAGAAVQQRCMDVPRSAKEPAEGVCSCASSSTFRKPASRNQRPGPLSARGSATCRSLGRWHTACSVPAWRGRRNCKCCTCGCSTAAARSRSPSKGRLTSGWQAKVSKLLSS